MLVGGLLHRVRTVKHRTRMHDTAIYDSNDFRLESEWSCTHSPLPLLSPLTLHIIPILERLSFSQTHRQPSPLRRASQQYSAGVPYEPSCSLRKAIPGNISALFVDDGAVGRVVARLLLLLPPNAGEAAGS
ncbi:hypothetical protein KC322_g41 [Hortaea werneckii]|nr:hypothetical protein KC322_g41 [Hortaea werneckii]